MRLMPARDACHRQVDVLQHLGASLNVAYCYGAYEQPQCVGIVMELLSGGELWSRIRNGQYSEAGESCAHLDAAASANGMPSNTRPMPLPAGFGVSVSIASSFP